MLQGCELSDFSLISDFFTSTPLKIIFEILSVEQVTRDFMMDSDFLKKYLY